MRRALIAALFCCCIVPVAACSGPSRSSATLGDGGGAGDTAMPRLDGGSSVVDGAAVSDADGDRGSDGSLLPEDSAALADSSSPADASSADGGAPPDSAAAVPPFVDPFDGASGCPDGGYPLGRAPCAAAFPISGYASLDGVFQPAACDNNNDNYGSVWFASASGYGQDTTNVHVYFSTPLQGVVGAQPVTVSIDVPNASFSRLTWSTPPGACTVTLDSDVCWDFEQVQYYLVAGTGHCTSPALSQGDAGASLTVGDFWFQTLSYP